MLANTLTNTAGGIVAIADINLSNATLTTPSPVIPDGKYVYTAMVTDLAGNASQISPPSQIVTIDTSTPATLPQPVLLTDTGRSVHHDITDANNSATTAMATATINSNLGIRDRGHVRRLWLHERARRHAQRRWRQRRDRHRHRDERRGHRHQRHQRRRGYTSAPTVVIDSPPSNAPQFNAFNVLPDATVVLYRNNQEVSRVNLTTGGPVPISDLNGGTQPGQNPIPDGVYVYRVQQIDAAGNPSALSSGLTVTIDHTPPVTPFPPVLEAASDTSNGLDHTSRNNNPSPQKRRSSTWPRSCPTPA